MDPRTRLIRPLPGSISIESEGDLRILCARGELDSAVVQDFKDRQGREPMVVDAIDAGAVTFISSTGIAVMLRCLEASKAAGHAAVLRASSPRVDRVLQLSGMDGAFRRESTDQARADPR